jgi:hypothetical protein
MMKKMIVGSLLVASMIAGLPLGTDDARAGGWFDNEQVMHIHTYAAGWYEMGTYDYNANFANWEWDHYYRAYAGGESIVTAGWRITYSEGWLLNALVFNGSFDDLTYVYVQNMP